MEEVDKYAKIIWEYMLMHQKPAKADAIIALGSNDIRVADYAAELYKAGYAPFILCSGGIAHRDKDDLNKPPWGETEALAYQRRLISLGIPQSAFVLENQATNTSENFTFSKKLIEEKNLGWKSFIVVQKKFSERRVWATGKKVWPEMNLCVVSSNVSYGEYMNNPDSEYPIRKEIFLGVMVGDLIRIKEYPKIGFQIEQEIPEGVWDAGQKLIDLGFNKYLPK